MNSVMNSSTPLVKSPHTWEKDKLVKRERVKKYPWISYASGKERQERRKKRRIVLRISKALYFYT